ncbi:hypothetical protein QN277_006027 [Acacia crassicarpa]|uniref:Glycosyltransferase n=1 Tax=Acacia crassicarpa TaxID=499986 RepID=A0AAE1IXH5_9FABA|nr:hypothetical protein QN277_006027 [Acacia crassicarpa]
MADQPLHVAMISWFGIGHFTPNLYVANKLAGRGHRVSFFVPKKAILKVKHLNHHPDLISFIPINVPHVDGLPPGAETTNDVPFSSHPLLMKAMDLTEPFIEASLRDLKPHLIFYDYQHWLPQITRRLGIKAIIYFLTGPAILGYMMRKPLDNGDKTVDPDTELMVPPPGFPPTAIRLKLFEAKKLKQSTADMEGEGAGVSFQRRMATCFSECDAMVFKAFREIEGPYLDFLERRMGKKIFSIGPVLPNPPPNATLEERWAKWLASFSPKSVIYCSFGSECVLSKHQFQELILGLELTGMPFLAALRPPVGAETVESALPEGFDERVKGRGIVHGGWVQQLLMLNHPNVGCFLSHCGSGSMTEALCSEPLMVFIPNAGDQLINSKILCGDQKVAVEVERRDEDGVFTREGVCKAVKMVMDSESEIGQTIRSNHKKLRQILLAPGLEDAYLDEFIHTVRSMLI